MRLLISCIAFVFLPGCMSTSFDCKRQNGLSCVSLYEVNDKISSKEIGQNGLKKAKKKLDNYKSAPKPVTLTSQNSKVAAIDNTRVPIRVPEQTASIVIFPYETDDGIYHQGTVLHTVLSKAHWAG